MLTVCAACVQFVAETNGKVAEAGPEVASLTVLTSVKESLVALLK